MNMQTPAPEPPPIPEPLNVSFEEVWTFESGGEIWGAVTISQGIVYFGSDDGVFYALDAESGNKAWTFETGFMIRSRPAVTEGSVFFTDDDNALYRLDAQSGKKLWRSELSDSGVRLDDWDYLQSSPLVVDGVVYVGSADTRVYAVDVATGEILWQYQTRDRVRSSPALADGVVYVGSWDGRVYALDAATGEEIWNFNTTGPKWHSVQPSPIVVDGVVYIGSRNPAVYALDAQTGEEVWTLDLVNGWIESSASLVNGILYVGSSDQRSLFAIDAATGEQVWRTEVEGYAWSSPVVADNLVAIGTASEKQSSGALRVHDARTGDGLYEFSVGAGDVDKFAVSTILLTASDTLVVTTLEGVVSSPIISDGVIYFGGLDGVLYAIRYTLN